MDLPLSKESSVDEVDDSPRWNALPYPDSGGVRPFLALSRPLREWLVARPLTDPGLRLALGLLHLTQVRGESTPGGSDRIRAHILSECTKTPQATIGPTAIRGNRAIRAGIRDVDWHAICDVLDMPHGSDAICWRLSEPIFDLLTGPREEWGLLDIRSVRRLRMARSIRVHLELTQIWRANWPRVTWTLEQAATLMGLPGWSTWEHVSRPLLQALRQVCTQEGGSVIIRTEHAIGSRIVASLTVSLVHPTTKWERPALAKVDRLTTEMILVPADGSGPFRLRPAEVNPRALKPAFSFPTPTN